MPPLEYGPFRIRSLRFHVAELPLRYAGLFVTLLKCCEAEAEHVCGLHCGISESGLRDEVRSRIGGTARALASKMDARQPHDAEALVALADLAVDRFFDKLARSQALEVA